MRAEFLKMMKDYLTEKNKGIHIPPKDPLAEYIRHDVPAVIRKEASLTEQFIVEGSPGKGNWAEVPWLCIYKKRITSSAETGYYIAYLFRADMDGVYLSLNMGWTQFERKYGSIDLALSKITATAFRCRQILDSFMEDFSTDPINFHANGRLARGYEKGHICGKYYPKTAMPNDITLVSDLNDLKGVYRELEGKLNGRDIVTLLDQGDLVIDQSEQEDSQYNKDIDKVEPIMIPNTPQPTPPFVWQKGRKKYQLNTRLGHGCKQKADYKCELDPTHKTFISRLTNHNYVEIHHLIPMAYQERYENNSLDVPGNIVALCPTCHKQLHLGNKAEAQIAIQTLFQKREAALNEAGIVLGLTELLSYY